MKALAIRDVRPFVPAQDFSISRDFYVALGWTVDWCDNDLALLVVAEQRFYLQRYYVKEWAENCMLHVGIEDADACFDHISALIDSGRFPGVRVARPKDEPYGARVTYAWDPSGVLLHLAQSIAA